MPLQMEKSLALAQPLREELARTGVLYMVREKEWGLHADLPGADRALAAVMASGLDDLWTVEKKSYRVSRKGELIWENWKARWWDFVERFDVFAGVDLQEGRFAERDDDFEAVDHQGRPVWEDLRIAVSMRTADIAGRRGRRTALNAFTTAFLSLLSQGRLQNSREWQFDLAFDSIFWKDVENIVNTQLWPRELGWGNTPWEEVIDDIIERGDALARKRSGRHYTAAPPGPLAAEREVLEQYGSELELYGWRPEYFCRSYSWRTHPEGLAQGAIGPCWSHL